MNSCLYECSIVHHRLAPKVHSFRYRIFMFYLDLDELSLLSDQLTFFSRNRFNLYTFRDGDHLQASTTDLKASLTAYLSEQGITLPADGRVMLLTLPRVLGYIFNPVSFYFCFRADGSELCAVVQVGNTFREMKLFLIRESQRSGFFHLLAPKLFYVSPFSSLSQLFDFNLGVPTEKLQIRIDDQEQGATILRSALTGHREELTTSRLLWFMLKYPLITLKVIGLIHWHAFLLWLKRIPYYRKAADPELQREVLRPHSSIAS